MKVLTRGTSSTGCPIRIVDPRFDGSLSSCLVSRMRKQKSCSMGMQRGVVRIFVPLVEVIGYLMRRIADDGLGGQVQGIGA